MNEYLKIGGFACDLRVAGMEETIEKMNQLNKLLGEARQLIYEISNAGLQLELTNLFAQESNQKKEDPAP